MNESFMIGYITLGTNDLEISEHFYDKLFAIIGIKQLFKTERMIAWGKDFNSPMLAITIPFNGERATIGNGCMVALKVNDEKTVNLMYEKAIELGGLCEGEPGPRGKSFYGAYFRDLDGNKLNVHC